MQNWSKKKKSERDFQVWWKDICAVWPSTALNVGYKEHKFFSLSFDWNEIQKKKKKKKNQS